MEEDSLNVMKKASKEVVGIYGLGYVGLTFALALTKQGYKVIGIDRDSTLIENLRDSRTHIEEPEISILLGNAISSGNLRIASSLNDQEMKSIDVHVITVGTPIIKDHIDDSSVIDVVSRIALGMKEDSLVILRSTLEIGTTRNKVFPILRKSNKNFFLAMCPERTIEGNAISEILSIPQVVGGIDNESVNAAERFFAEFCEKVLVFSTPEAAELIKLANNTYRDLTFGFANELSELCGSLGLNSIEIINGANYGYPRSNIARPGPSGGPCLTKDPWILFESAKKLGVEMSITRAARERNGEYVVRFLKKSLTNFDREIKKICCLGLSFKGKPRTRDVRGSSVHEVLRFFEQYEDVTFYGYEPAGKVSLDSIVQPEDINDSLVNADVVILLNNFDFDPEITSKISELASPNALILDFWHQVRRERLQPSQILKVW